MREAGRVDRGARLNLRRPKREINEGAYIAVGHIYIYERRMDMKITHDWPTPQSSVPIGPKVNQNRQFGDDRVGSRAPGGGPGPRL